MFFIRHSLSVLDNASVVVKASIATIILSYLIGLIPGAYEALSIAPSLLLPPNFRVWTLVTGLIVEKSFINLCINIPVIILTSRHLEPLWGALELLKFIGIASIGSALLTSFVSLAAYAITKNYAFWMVQFSGMAGVIGGISVAFKQITPDQVIDFKYYKMRVHDVPVVAILLFTFLSVVRILSYTQPIMVACGIIMAWIYLRFYQSHGRGVRGDMSENFEAASLFPHVCRPAVRLVSVALFKTFVSLGFCKNPVRTYDVGAPSSITISLPGTDPADAERRRKKALRALNERLVQMQEKKTSVGDEDDEVESWPGMNETEKSDTQEEGEAGADDETVDNGFVRVDNEAVTPSTIDVPT